MVELGVTVISQCTKVTSLSKWLSVCQSCIILYDVDQQELMFNAYS